MATSNNISETNIEAMKYKGSSFLANPDVAEFSEATETESAFSPTALDFEECKGMYARVCAGSGSSTQDVSLRDPLTHLRMRLPCRGIDCTHLQCFDFTNYKQVNEQHQRHTSEYRCPVCNELRNPSSLFLDPIAYALSQHATQENISFLGEEDIGKFRCGAVEGASGANENEIVDILSLQPWINGKGLKSVGSDELKRTSLDDLILFINSAKQDVLSKVWSLAEKRCHQIIAQRPFCCSTYQSFRHALQVVPGIGTGRATTYIDLLYDHLESVRGRGKQRTYATIHGNQLAVVGDTVAYKDILRNFGGKYVKRSSPTSVVVDGSHVDCWLLDLEQKETILKGLSIPFKAVGEGEDDGMPASTSPFRVSSAASSSGSAQAALSGAAAALDNDEDTLGNTEKDALTKTLTRRGGRKGDRDKHGARTASSHKPARVEAPPSTSSSPRQDDGAQMVVEVRGGSGASPASLLRPLSMPVDPPSPSTRGSGSGSGSGATSARSNASSPRIEVELLPIHAEAAADRVTSPPVSVSLGSGREERWGGSHAEELAAAAPEPVSTPAAGSEGGPEGGSEGAGPERIISDYDEAERSGRFVYLTDYSSGYCAVFGLLKSSKDRLKALGGKFLGGNFAMHRFVRNPPLCESIKASGWRFPAEKRDQLVRLYSIQMEAQQPMPHPPTLRYSKEDAFNQLEAIKSYNSMSDHLDGDGGNSSGSGSGGGVSASSSSSTESALAGAAVVSRGNGSSGAGSRSSSSISRDYSHDAQVHVHAVGVGVGVGVSSVGEQEQEQHGSRVSDSASSDGDCSSSSNDDSITLLRLGGTGGKRSASDADADAMDGASEEDGTSMSSSSRSGSGSGEEMLGAVTVKGHGRSSTPSGKGVGLVQRVSPDGDGHGENDDSDESGSHKKRRVGDYHSAGGMHTGGEPI